MSQRKPMSVYLNYQERMHVAYLCRTLNCPSLGAVVAKISAGELVVVPVVPLVPVPSLRDISAAVESIDSFYCSHLL